MTGFELRHNRKKVECIIESRSLHAEALISVIGACAEKGFHYRLEDNSNAAPNMSLDAFMAEHTSEDNASFSEILEGINKRKRERYQWLHGQIEQKKVPILSYTFKAYAIKTLLRRNWVTSRFTSSATRPENLDMNVLAYSLLPLPYITRCASMWVSIRSLECC